MEIKEILQKLQNNEISLEQAEKQIKNNQYEDLGYAKIDHNRKERIGTSEVIFCQNKPNEFLSKICTSIYKENGEVLGTRATKEQYELVKKEIPNIEYDNISRIFKIEKPKEKVGNIVICTGGTADIPVAEEAAQTAEFFGSYVERIYDVGVAGIHRILSQREKITKSKLHNCNCRDGRSSSICCGRNCKSASNSSSNISWIWCKSWRNSSTFKYDKFLQ